MIRLHRDDLETLNRLLDSLDTQEFTLVKTNETGIGHCVEVHTKVDLHGLKGTFVYELVGPESW